MLYSSIMNYMNKVTFTWGRFQPPHWDHEKLFKECDRIANEGKVIIYPSWTYDKKKNPLTHPKKIYWLKKMFRDHLFSYDTKLNTIFEVILHLTSWYYDDLNLVVGADRFEEFNRKIGSKVPEFLDNFNKEHDTTFKIKFTVHATEHFESIHSSTLRDLAKNDHFAPFYQMYKMNTLLDHIDIVDLWSDLRRGMGLYNE